MCGIVGIVGDLTGKEEKIFKDLLILDTLRGIDSTGVAVVGAGQQVKIAKTVGDAFQLFDTSQFGEALKGKNQVLIGHNRWGTMGKNIRKNAHPFDFETVVGVHNGTLKNKYHIPDHLRYDTDSEALYSYINDAGIDTAMEKVDGAYSLVWYNKEEETINFLRNKERPMTYAFSEDGKVLFYASEPWMISVACAREAYKIKSVQDLPEDQLHTFKVPAVGQAFGEAEVRPLKPAPFHWQTTTQTAYGGTTAHTTGGGTKQEGTPPHEKRGTATNVADFLARGLGNKHPNQNDIVQHLEATLYSRTPTGSFYVVCKSKDYPKTTFRVHMKTMEECRAILQHSGPYIGQVGLTSWEEGKCVSKIRPDTFLEDTTTFDDDEQESNVCVVRKADHKGNLITKEDFGKRYTQCGWCCADVSFDSKFKAIGHNEILCEDCASDPEVLKDIGIA